MKAAPFVSHTAMHGSLLLSVIVAFAQLWMHQVHLPPYLKLAHISHWKHIKQVREFETRESRRAYLNLTNRKEHLSAQNKVIEKNQRQPHHVTANVYCGMPTISPVKVRRVTSQSGLSSMSKREGLGSHL